MLRSDFVHYVYAAELISLAEDSRKQKDPSLEKSGSVSVSRFFKGLTGGNKSKDKEKEKEPTLHRSTSRGLFTTAAAGTNLLSTSQRPAAGSSGSGGSGSAVSGADSGRTAPQAVKHQHPTPPLAMVTGQQSPMGVQGQGTHFGRLLRQCLSVSPLSCPSAEESEKDKDKGPRIAPPPPTTPTCCGKATVSIHALQAPLALAISVGWTQAKESPETLQSFLDLLSYRVLLSDLFDIQQPSSPQNATGNGNGSIHGSLQGSGKGGGSARDQSCEMARG